MSKTALQEMAETRARALERSVAQLAAEAAYLRRVEQKARDSEPRGSGPELAKLHGDQAAAIEHRLEELKNELSAALEIVAEEVKGPDLGGDVTLMGAVRREPSALPAEEDTDNGEKGEP